jgi:predicted DNA-binding transcriptional regulator AlpA
VRKRNAQNRSRDDLIKTRDVCQKARVCQRTVDYWREKNLIPYVKLGKAVRFIPSDVDAFIRSRRVGGTTPMNTTAQIRKKMPMTRELTT